MSMVCMAAVNDNDKTFTIGRLQERFPEIPEAVISNILTQHAYNMEKCMTILSKESDRYLYGSVCDSPPALDVPLSIQIPNNPQSDLTANYYHGIDSPTITEERSTISLSTASNTMPVSGAQVERHHHVDEYNRKLIQHQQQRLERLKKEADIEKQKLYSLQNNVKSKKDELMNKKFRVASNPSKTDVDHLEEETQVLREEIDQMSNEIDRMKTLPQPMKKSLSFPQPNPPPHHPHPHPPTHYLNNLPQTQINGPRPVGPRPPWLLTQRSQSPVRDPSLEDQGWIFLPQNHPLPSATTTTTPTDTPNRAHDDTEVNWVCKRCTLENHGALNTCELCEQPRR